MRRWPTSASARAACASLATVPDSAIEQEERTLTNLGGRFLVIGDAEYPAALAALPDAPPVLSMLGDPSLLGRPTLAIVGAREASLAGRQFRGRTVLGSGCGGFRRRFRPRTRNRYGCP